MILRMLVLVLVLGGSITSTLFAGTARGAHLISESGGAAGIPGVAGPAGAPGIAGAAGAVGIQGVPGIPGAPGILDYSDFYALQGTDNGPIAPGSPVAFPRTASSNNVITAQSPTTFMLPTIGTYLVQFQVGTTSPGQLGLTVGGNYQASTQVGTAGAGGTLQIVGISLVTTTIANTTLSVSVPSAAGSNTITIPAGTGGQYPYSAHLTITRIQ